MNVDKQRNKMVVLAARGICSPCVEGGKWLAADRRGQEPKMKTSWEELLGGGGRRSMLVVVSTGVSVWF